MQYYALQDAFIRRHSDDRDEGVFPHGLGVPASTLNLKVSLASA